MILPELHGCKVHFAGLITPKVTAVVKLFLKPSSLARSTQNRKYFAAVHVASACLPPPPPLPSPPCGTSRLFYVL